MPCFFFCMYIISTDHQIHKQWPIWKSAPWSWVFLARSHRENSSILPPHNRTTTPWLPHRPFGPFSHGIQAMKVERLEPKTGRSGFSIKNGAAFHRSKCRVQSIGVCLYIYIYTYIHVYIYILRYMQLYVIIYRYIYIYTPRLKMFTKATAFHVPRRSPDFSWFRFTNGNPSVSVHLKLVGALEPFENKIVVKS